MNSRLARILNARARELGKGPYKPPDWKRLIQEQDARDARWPVLWLRIWATLGIIAALVGVGLLLTGCA